MNDADRESEGTDNYAPGPAAAGDEYQAGSSQEEGLGEKVREALGGLFGRGDHDTDDATDEEEHETPAGTPGGVTDYMTSNYSPDTGQPPSDSDIDDVSQHYT